MKNGMKKAVLTLALALAVFSAAEAGVVMGNGSRYALVIGNGEYRTAPKLANPGNDAKDVAAALAKLGYEVELRENLDLAGMNEAVGAFLAKLAANQNSAGFFWFAGWGAQINGEDWMMPVDVKIEGENMMRAGSYSLYKLLDGLKKTGNTMNVIVLDSCRDNPFSGATRPLPNLPADSGQSSNFFVMHSASPGQVALDGKGRNSPFAQAFLKNLASKDPLPLAAMEMTRETFALTEGKQRPCCVYSMTDKNFSLTPKKR